MELRVRVGICAFPDGWNVVVDWDGVKRVYDPTYADEAEAVAKAREVADAFRGRAAREGWVLRDPGG